MLTLFLYKNTTEQKKKKCRKYIQKTAAISNVDKIAGHLQTGTI